MTGLIVCLALAAAITLAALIGDRMRELRATVDLLLIPEDAADDRAQQAEWDRYVAAAVALCDPFESTRADIAALPERDHT